MLRFFASGYEVIDEVHDYGFRNAIVGRYSRMDVSRLYFNGLPWVGRGGCIYIYIYVYIYITIYI